MTTETEPKTYVTEEEKKMTMQAAVITEPGQVEMQTMAIPEPAANEVRVHLEGCGLCASDLPVWEGREWFKYPREAGSPGHEAWGKVDAVGENVKTVREGYRVTGLFYNAYAEYDLAKETEVVELPGSLSNKPFPGEPLGCAMNIFKRSGIERSNTVAIIGIGWIGSLLVQLAKQTGATVIACSRRKSSLKKAKEFGADHIISLSNKENVVKKVENITEGMLCDCVIEATGKQEALDLAGKLTAIRGNLIIAGYHQGDHRKIDMQLWNWRGINVINAHERDAAMYIQGIRKAIQYMSRGTLNPFPLFTHSFPLEHIGKAFEMQQQKLEGFTKALITLNQ